jgi:hypothetical protein
MTQTIFFRRPHVTPAWFVAGIRTTGDERIRFIPGASSKGGDWRTKQAEVLSPEVSLPGSFVTVPSTAHPLEPP